MLVRFALGVSVWAGLALVQAIFWSLLYPGIVEDKLAQFTDICSIANIRQETQGTATIARSDRNSNITCSSFLPRFFLFAIFVKLLFVSSTFFSFLLFCHPFFYSFLPFFYFVSSFLLYFSTFLYNYFRFLLCS